MYYVLCIIYIIYIIYYIILYAMHIQSVASYILFIVHCTLTLGIVRQNNLFPGAEVYLPISLFIRFLELVTDLWPTNWWCIWEKHQPLYWFATYPLLLLNHFLEGITVDLHLLYKPGAILPQLLNWNDQWKHSWNALMML